MTKQRQETEREFKSIIHSEVKQNERKKSYL